MVDVVALGAIVESEDLTAPPRRPKLDMGGYVQPWTPEKLDAYLQARDRVFAEDYVYPPDRRTGSIQFGWANLKSPERGGLEVETESGGVRSGWANLRRKLAKLGFKSVFCAGPPETMMAGRRKKFESGSLSLYAEEFADLSDGRRVILKDDRGWSLRPTHRQDSSWKFDNGLALTFDAATVLQPDYNELWLEWVVERLGFFGTDVDLVSVHAAPFKVEFSPHVQRELRQRKPNGQAPDASARSRAMMHDRERRVVLDVVALGAIVEIEDLTGPPRWPALYGGYCVHRPAPEELGTPRPLPRRGPESEGLEAERQKMLESGKPQFYAEEFADLSDGRRVILKDDRGWSHWPMNSPDSNWKVATGHELTIEAIAMLNPGDDELWMEWVVERLRFFGIDVDSVSVRAAPFHVEFGPRVRHELRQRKSDDG